MRFYTKEWSALMQRLDYTGGVRRIPDKEYSGKEIRGIYEKELREFVESERRDHDTPPVFQDLSEELAPDNFDPEDWFFSTESGELRHPASIEEARKLVELNRRQAEEEFQNRPPFDPVAAEKVFRTLYKDRLRFAAQRYPAWVSQQTDRRLLALDLLPESVFRRLKKEEEQNRRAFEKINRAAKTELSRQQIPDEIRDTFHFHDSALLSMHKRGRNYEMLLRKDGGWFGEGVTPYIKVIFTDAVLLEREEGLVPRAKKTEDETFWSGCDFLYHEIYRMKDGYEVHMMFALRRHNKLAYLTVKCADIRFEDNIQVDKI